MSLESQTSRTRQFFERTFELSDEALGGRDSRLELLGAAVFLSGIFLMAAVLFGGNGDEHIGTIGTWINGAMLLIFGNVVSFIFPPGIMTLGVFLFLGKSIKWSCPRFAGLMILVVSICGMLAIRYADTIDDGLAQQSMRLSGIIGTFIVNFDGLALVARMGQLGAFLVLSVFLIAGLVMMTGLRLSSLLFLDGFGSEGHAPYRMPDADDEDVEVEAKPKRQKKSVTTKNEAPVEQEELDAPGQPIVMNEFAGHQPAPSNPGFVAGFFGAVGGMWDSFTSMITGRKRYAMSDSLLHHIEDSPEWLDSNDQDVKAAARALELHELETRLQKRLKVRRPEDFRGYADDEDAGDDEQEFEDFLDEEEKAEAPVEEYDDSKYEDEVNEAEADEEDEIIFTDNSAPSIPKANVGEGLAKLFPNRWPKEGKPLSAEEREQEEILAQDETQDQVFDRSEERMLRQTGEASDSEQSDLLDGDPLFTADYDTRPHGPLGEETEYTPEVPVRARHYQLPDIDLLAEPPIVESAMTREEVIEMSQILVKTLADYGIEGKVTQVHQGPVVTRIEFRPAAGTKVSRIVGLEQDIAMGMKALSVRILAPIPGKNAVGIEVPNKVRQGVYVKELISHDQFWDAESPLEVAIGKTIDGKPFFADLAKMPHLLIAGATGAGKSVCLNTIICSLLYRQPPSRVKLIMVDPKRVELSVYGDIPHLLAPVVCEPKRAAAALDWAVEQMEERYKKLVDFGVRNITGYNKLCENPESNKKTAGRSLEPMPYMVIIVDELADLMIVAKAEVEESIQRLAQMARAVGIHLILATQRPSVNVITGIIKANFPSRVAFQVSQKVDSRTILDSNGAESLLGKGDMLFSKGGADKPIRIQGAFLSDDEVEHIAEHCRTQQPVVYEVEEFEPKLSDKEQKELAKMMGVQSMDDLDDQDRMVRGTNKPMGKVTAGMFIPHDGGSARAGDDEIDEALVRAAARLILDSRKASVSLLQRRLKVGFARAGRLMDMLEDMGIVGPFLGSKPRDIIVDPEAAIEQLDRLEAALSQGVSVDELLDEEEDESVE